MDSWPVFVSIDGPAPEFFPDAPAQRIEADPPAPAE